MPIGQMPWPLAGIQGRTVDEIGSIIADIANRLGRNPTMIDVKEYQKELEEAETQLVYKSLLVEPLILHDTAALRFNIRNTGNVDLELLMFHVFVPKTFCSPNGYVPQKSHEITPSFRDGLTYMSYACYSNRGVCGALSPLLRPIISPSMGKVQPNFLIPIKRGDVPPDVLKMKVYYQIFAVNFRTEEEHTTVAALLGLSQDAAAVE
jgi:hypothetical protein